jgi:hypothetical protein
MVREDILGGLKNALERGDTLQEAKDSFISAGYSKADVEEAAASLEKVQINKKIEVPTLYTATLQAPAAPSKPGEKPEKPLPQIKVKRKFQLFLLIPIVLVSAAIAYLVYSIFLAQ